MNFVLAPDRTASGSLAGVRRSGKKELTGMDRMGRIREFQIRDLRFQIRNLKSSALLFILYILSIPVN